tara:strand:+ start:38838 stop:39710 length:873 start_codon:yes stop_codon:yes gene_type:complete
VNNKRFFKLDHFKLLFISGSGSKEMLQGQLTCDMEKLKKDNFLKGAMCNHKGRVISSFYIFQDQQTDEEAFYMVLKEDLIEKSLKNLENFSPFYKTKMNIETELECYGIDKYLFKQLFKEGISEELKYFSENSYYLPFKGLDLGIYINDKKNQIEKVQKDSTGSIQDWLEQDLINKNVEISKDISEVYLPHELGYHLNGRVDFEKGCYTGQEIIARMQYRAKKLPNLLLYESEKIERAINGKIINKENKKIGSIVSSYSSKNKNLFLITSKTKESIVFFENADCEMRLVN